MTHPAIYDFLCSDTLATKLRAAMSRHGATARTDTLPGARQPDTAGGDK